MKLDDFEYYTEEKVLERGQKLFETGKVRYKDKFGANWYFDVQGSKIYRIVICVNKNNVIMFEDCDCPYSQRHLCKHVIACLLYIRKELNIQKETMLSKFLKKNPELIEKGDYLVIVKKFMQSIFRRIRKGGFIEYDKMVDFAIAIDEILEYLKISTTVIEDKKLLLNICLYLINTISSTKYNCDDSNGEITDSFYTITKFLEEIYTEPNHEFYSQIYLDLTNPKNEYEFEQEKLIELAAILAQTDIDKQQIKKYRTKVL